MSRVTRVLVDFEPVGRRVEVKPDATLLDAAQTSGVQLVSVCGGIGACRGCMVRLIEGVLTSATLEEEAQLTSGELAAQCRLACQASALTNVKIDIPPESLTTPQRLQIEGESGYVELDPVVAAIDIVLLPPSNDDLRPDMRRLSDALGISCHAEPAVMRAFGRRVRQSDWALRAALRDSMLIAALPTGTPLLGLAVDVGCTKLAAYLINLDSGVVLAKAGAMNPQIAYGEDVISRIVYCNEHADGADLLQRRVVESLNELVSALCCESQMQSDQIVEAVLVGNTVMHHLLLGLPVEPLGVAPYIAITHEALEVPAAALDLQIASGARVYLPPIIAGYVGADHVAMLIAAQMDTTTQTVLALDIGTNTEITLAYQGQLWSCSCASGPAFEGAHISHGMRAAVGAIERVQSIDGQIMIQTIGSQPAVGICGSGILDAVAVMAELGIVDGRGALNRQHPRVRNNHFILVEGAQADAGQAIVVTRQDISEIQLAKAAIRTGIELLLREVGISAEAIESFLIAGAFGSYIAIESAVRIGMFPALPHERFSQIGNAAGTGACHLLVSGALRSRARALTERIRYVELTTHPDFQTTYIHQLALNYREQQPS